jgi:hypothetical protein
MRELGTLKTGPCTAQINGEERSVHGDHSFRGMARFFATHECNDVCQALQLEPFDLSKRQRARAQGGDEGKGEGEEPPASTERGLQTQPVYYSAYSGEYADAEVKATLERVCDRMGAGKGCSSSSDEEDSRATRLGLIHAEFVKLHKV